MCRDYAHLVIALLRGLDVPARLVSVYAPGLSPMDFHAVAEAWLDDQWYVIDATSLAPRSSLVRIATGQDASETAFLSQYGAAVDLRGITVTAVVDDLPRDDVTQSSCSCAEGVDAARELGASPRRDGIVPSMRK